MARGSGGKGLTVAERFWRYVDRPNSDSCWVWTSATGHNGYGQLWVGKRNRPAHRLSYEMHVGPIPEGMLVCHTCDNPPCVNPAHLFLGNAKANAHDMCRKNRLPQRRFTNDQVHKIKSEMAAGRTCYSLAKEYGISHKRMCGIKNGESYRHIDGYKMPPPIHVREARRWLETRERAFRLRQEGKTFKEIGEIMGVSKVHAGRLVRKWQEHGLT